MNKNQLEFAKLQLGAKKFGALCMLAKHFGTLFCLYWCARALFDGLTSLSAANPAAIHALAELVKNLKLGTITAYLVAVGTSAGWIYERRGKKRLLREHAGKRRSLESDDAYRGSSGLTESGDTPNAMEPN